MKKLFFVLALGAFVACNSGETTEATADSINADSAAAAAAAAMPADTTMHADSTMHTDSTMH